MLLEIEVKTKIRLEFIQHLFTLKNEDAYCSLRKGMKVLYSELIF